MSLLLLKAYRQIISGGKENVYSFHSARPTVSKVIFITFINLHLQLFTSCFPFKSIFFSSHNFVNLFVSAKILVVAKGWHLLFSFTLYIILFFQTVKNPAGSLHSLNLEWDFKYLNLPNSQFICRKLMTKHAFYTIQGSLLSIKNLHEHWNKKPIFPKSTVIKNTKSVRSTIVLLRQA